MHAPSLKNNEVYYQPTTHFINGIIKKYKHSPYAKPLMHHHMHYPII